MRHTYIPTQTRFVFLKNPMYVLPVSPSRNHGYDPGLVRLRSPMKITPGPTVREKKKRCEAMRCDVVRPRRDVHVRLSPPVPSPSGLSLFRHTGLGVGTRRLQRQGSQEA